MTASRATRSTDVLPGSTSPSPRLFRDAGSFIFVSFQINSRSPLLPMARRAPHWRHGACQHNPVARDANSSSRSTRSIPNSSRSSLGLAGCGCPTSAPRHSGQGRPRVPPKKHLQSASSGCGSRARSRLLESRPPIARLAAAESERIAVSRDYSLRTRSHRVADTIRKRPERGLLQPRGSRVRDYVDNTARPLFLPVNRICIAPEVVVRGFSVTWHSDPKGMLGIPKSYWGN
jgi:hypothetical protein